MNKIFYYEGKQAVIDILNYKILESKKFDHALIGLKNLFNDKKMPVMPIRADKLMSTYKIPEGKQLGDKLKIIEDEWVNNNFQISDKQVDNILKD